MRATVLLLLLVAGTPAALAQAPAPASRPARGGGEITLDEIVVTGQPEEESPSIRRIRRDELEAGRTAASAAEALEREPALYASTGRRGERIFSMRGFGQREVVVLLDGAPAYIPFDGQVDLGMLPAELIDHVTIAKGPASVLLGPNGMGGAVNIVTRRPGRGPLLATSGEVGRGDSLQLGGIHSASFSRLGYTVYGGLRRREAFPLSGDFVPAPRENGVLRDNSDSSFAHVGGSLEARPAAGHTLSGSLAFVDGEHGVPIGLVDPTARYWRFTVWRSLAATVGHQGSYLARTLQIEELLFLRLFDNLLDSYDDPTYTTQTTARALHSWYHDQMFGGRVRARYRLPRAPWGPTDLRLWLGFEHDRHEDQESIAPLEDTSVNRSLLTIAPEAQAYLGERWSVLAALQLDLELRGSTAADERSSMLELGPLFAATFDPVPSVSLRASVARRTRFPTLRERFTVALGNRVPNPELGAESAWHFGLDATWRGPRGLAVEASLFDAEARDLIDLLSVGGGLQQFRNIPGARLLGCELSVEAAPFRFLRLRGGYAFLHARRSEPFDGSLELGYRPAHKASVELTLLWRWIELTTSVRVTGPRAYQHPASEEWKSLSSYAVWDAGLTVRPSRFLAVWVRARNLLDALFETEAGYPDPGRELWVGLRVAYDRERGRRAAR